jgi:hypothetical protein
MTPSSKNHKEAAGKPYRFTAAYFDRAWSPRLHAGEVVDHDRGASAVNDVAELLGALEIVTSDVDGVRLEVVYPPCRHDVRRPVLADCRDSGEAAVTMQISEFRLCETLRGIIGPPRSRGRQMEPRFGTEVG